MCLQFGPDVIYFFTRKKVPAVPESLLKRRKAFATMKAMRLKKMLAEKKVSCMLQQKPVQRPDLPHVNATFALNEQVFFNVFLEPQSDQETDLQEG